MATIQTPKCPSCETTEYVVLSSTGETVGTIAGAAGGAWLASAGGPKGLKAFGTGRSAGTGGCAHETGDGTN